MQKINFFQFDKKMVISERLRFEITLGLEVLFTIHIKSVGLELEFIHIIIVNYVLKTNNLVSSACCVLPIADAEALQVIAAV